MYSQNEYLIPFRKGKTVYSETALVVECPRFTDKEKNITLTLLYDVETIISVTDYSAEVTYEEGKDFIVKDGKILILSTSSIPRLLWSEYNPTEAPNDGLNAGYIDGGYILYTEGSAIVEKQIAITYEHKVDESIYVPKLLKDKLPKFAEKIHCNKPLKIGFWGDSITFGCNCSKLLGIAPFMPSWAQLTCDFIKNKYGCETEMINYAVGGTTVQWGLSAFEEKWTDTSALDLIVVAFGTNNGPDLSPEAYVEYIGGICKKFTEKFKDCEIVVISPCEGNRYCQDVKCHHDRLEKLYQLAEKWGSRVTIAPITQLHSEMLERKYYWDMTANNINHPNDMLIRIYAQTLTEIIASVV